VVQVHWIGLNVGQNRRKLVTVDWIGLDWIGSLSSWIGLDYILQNKAVSNSEQSRNRRID